MNDALAIDRETARRMVLRAQGLNGRWKPARGVDGAAEIVQRLRYVQIDTIAVVERAHHHTFWSRLPSYSAELLHELHAKQRRVFEYWAPAASYVPINDYRYYLRRMEGHANLPRTCEFLKKNRKLVRHILDRIRDEGALRSADFAAPPGRKSSGWWNWKPAKIVLDTLYSTGELMVTERRNFHRIYDLAERVLPAGVDTTKPELPDQIRWRIQRELETQGLARPGWWWMRAHGRADEILQEMVDAGEVCRVVVNDASGENLYALQNSIHRTSRPFRGSPNMFILSPFDSIMYDRRRADALFGFNYRLESYTPAAKRKYGYFCLPVLWGEQFIGRLDAKADRKQKRLLVHKLIFEPTAVGLDEAMAPLAEKIREFAGFNDCDDVKLSSVSPKRYAAAMRRELRRAQ